MSGAEPKEDVFLELLTSGDKLSTAAQNLLHGNVASASLFAESLQRELNNWNELSFKLKGA